MNETTHECPQCGDVHLSPSVHMSLTDAEIEAATHVHTPEKRPYADLAGHPVYLCIRCGARVTAEGTEWKPRGNYPWG